MAVLIALNLAAGTAFYLLGAWPVAPFHGRSMSLLVWWAFRKNYAEREAPSGSRSPSMN